MRTLTSLVLAAATTLVGWGCTEVKNIYITNYPDAAGVSDAESPRRDIDAASEHTGDTNDGGGSWEADADFNPIPEKRDVGISASDVPVSSDGDTNNVDVTPPFVEFYTGPAYFKLGNPRTMNATVRDVSPVDVKFDLTTAIGEHERVLVPYEQANFRGDTGIYEAHLPGAWDQPGLYHVDVTALDRAGNQSSTWGSIPVYDPPVASMPEFIGNPVVDLTYGTWKDFLSGPQFRDTFNRPSGRQRDKTIADDILEYEATLGPRVIDGREYTKMPTSVHLQDYPRENGAVELVYEFDNTNNYFVGMRGPVFETIDAVTTEAQARQMLGSR